MHASNLDHQPTLAELQDLTGSTDKARRLRAVTEAETLGADSIQVVAPLLRDSEQDVRIAAEPNAERRKQKAERRLLKPAPAPGLSVRMPSRPLSVSLAAAAATGLLLTVSLASAGPTAGPAGRADLPPSTRGPVRIAFTPDGARAVVTEKDSATLAVLDARSGSLLRRIETGGRGAEGLALTGEGFALVADPLGGSVYRVSLEQGRVTEALRLPGEPSEIVVAPNGGSAYVSLPALDEVAVLELPTLAEKARIAVGDRPRALALTGETLLVANFRSGELSFVDTVAKQERKRVRLRGRSLRDVALSADGKHAWITAQVPAEGGVTWVANDVWVNTLFRVDLNTGVAVEGRLDQTAAPVAEPDEVVPLADGRLAVTASGSDEAVLVSPGTESGGYLNPGIRARRTLGARPRGLALAPGGRHLWVANEISSTLSILDARTLDLVRTVDLGPREHPDPLLRGRYLFGSTGLTAGRQFSCNSCHPDGGSDGVVWEFVHVPDALAARNTRHLRSGVAGTAPFRWSGREQVLTEFIQDEISGLMHGPEQSPQTLQALAAFAESLPIAANPLRGPDGDFTPAARRGRALFEGKAGCVACHDGPAAGGSGRRAWIGTTAEGLTLDVPHLRGAFDSAPYLHDGRAATLDQVFSRWNSRQKHGNAHLLTATELEDLLCYVREL